jgi:hypothetical protein
LNGKVALFLLLAGCAAVAAAADARAQSPDKVERVVPRAQPAAPKPAPSPDQQSQIRELMRKAQAGEPENGFCSRVNWPSRGTLTANNIWLTLVPATGGTVLQRDKAFGLELCAVRRISGISTESGRKTRTIEAWACMTDGKPCQTQRTRMVENAPGAWAEQQ